MVREVEGQIYELLGERGGHELDREDVLAVLAKLDPPEAYLPEEGGYEAAAVLLPSRPVGRADRGATESRRAAVVGILGLLLIGLVMLWPATYLLAVAGVNIGVMLALLYGESFLMIGAGVPIFVLSIIWRRGGAWALVGMVAGALGVLVGLATAALFVSVK